MARPPAAVGYNGLPLPREPVIPRTGDAVHPFLKVAFSGNHGSPGEVCAIDWAYNAALPDVRRVLAVPFPTMSAALQSVVDGATVAAVIMLSNHSLSSMSPQVCRKLLSLPLQITDELLLEDHLFLGGPPGTVFPAHGPLTVLAPLELADRALEVLPMRLHDRIRLQVVTSFAAAAQGVMRAAAGSSEPGATVLALLNMRSLSFFRLRAVLAIEQTIAYRALVVRAGRPESMEGALHDFGEKSSRLTLAAVFKDQPGQLLRLMSSFSMRDMDISLVCSVPVLSDNEESTSDSLSTQCFLLTAEGQLSVPQLRRALGQVNDWGADVTVLGHYSVTRHLTSGYAFFAAAALQTTDDSPPRPHTILLSQPVDIVGRVPVEVALQILQYVASDHPRYLARAMRVSQQWKSLCSEPSLWRRLSRRLRPPPDVLHPDGAIGDPRADVQLQLRLYKSWPSIMRRGAGSTALPRNVPRTTTAAPPPTELANGYYYVQIKDNSICARLLRKRRVDEIVVQLPPNAADVLVALADRLIAVQMPNMSLHIYDLYASRDAQWQWPCSARFRAMRMSSEILVGVDMSSVYVFEIPSGRQLLVMHELLFNEVDVEGKMLAILAFDHILVFDLSTPQPEQFRCVIGKQARFIRILHASVYIGLMNGLLLKFDIRSGAIAFALRVRYVLKLFLLQSTQLVIFTSNIGTAETSMTVYDVENGRPLTDDGRCVVPLYLDDTIALFPGGSMVDMLADARRQLRWVQDSLKNERGRESAASRRAITATQEA